MLNDMIMVSAVAAAAKKVEYLKENQKRLKILEDACGYRGNDNGGGSGDGIAEGGCCFVFSFLPRNHRTIELKCV